jgi:hypothetical protein
MLAGLQPLIHRTLDISGSAPVYGWFTEGFDTRDLKEAKALLDALAAPGPFQRFGFDIPASLAGTYPRVMIPAFSVPSSILLHALSLRQLTRRKIRTQM